MSTTLVAAEPKKESRTANWVAALIFGAILFDGFDLTVYGAVLPTLTKDPTQIGAVSPALAGTLGSYALIGVLVGALTAGAIGDRVGRRKLLILGIVWFSVLMAVTSLAHSIAFFGWARFFTGIGLGLVIACAGATMAEFAPAGKKNLYNAIVYAGIPAGGVLASLGGIALLGNIGWRGLFLLGASPILLLVPFAIAKLPESPAWLLHRGQRERAEQVAIKNGLPLVDDTVKDEAARQPHERLGFAALVSPKYLIPTLLLGVMSFSGLLLTYGLNTWLPKIMEGYGYGKNYSLSFLLVLNFAALFGSLIASGVADRLGAPRIITSTFVMAAITLVGMTFKFPLAVLLIFIGLAGIGVIGTQVLIYGFASNYFPTNARGAGVAWIASAGRIGGILGPTVLGFITAGALQGVDKANKAAMAAANITAGTRSFYFMGAIALLGAVATFLVHRRGAEARQTTATTGGDEAVTSATV